MAGRVSSPVLVGRRAELRTMVDALDRAAAGAAVHLLVAGEAGIGKTRLSTETMRAANERGFRVMRGECVNVGSSSLPYGPFVEALRDLVREMDTAEVAALAGPGAADLARLVPSFDPLGTTAPAQAEWVQSRLFEALLGLLTRLAERSPTVIVIEDLHWADPATRETVSFLMRALRDVPVVLIGTYRTDELHRRHPLLPWLAELERGGRVERLELTRLDRDGLAALLTAILEVPPGPGLIDEVFSRSDGNPFFAEELLAAGRQGSASRRLPPTLREILLAHVATVAEPAPAVLGVAAVAGRRVEHELLARVARLPDGQLLDGLRAAVGAHLLIVESDDGQERYAFRHALVQEVVYDELLPGERRSLHRAFAEALAEEGPRAGVSEAGHWAELAHHWSAAREDRQAFEASLRAAEAAIPSFAFGAALQEYERALELWDGLDDAAELAGFDRVELLRRAGQAAYLGASYRRAVGHRREAVAGADAVADPLRAGILREELGRALYVLGDSAASLEAYRDAVATIPADPPSAERARAISGLGQIEMLLAHFAESRVLCEEAITVARAVGARAQEGHALNTLGTDLAQLGDCGAGIAALEESLLIAREVRDADDIGRAYVNLAESFDDCGDSARAMEITAEGIKVADEVGIGHSYGHYIRTGGVEVAYTLGRWDEAGRLLDDAATRTPIGSGPEAYRLATTLPYLVGRGSFEAVDADLPRALELIDVVHGAQFTGPIRGAAAERELWRHRPSAAMEHVELGLEYLVATADRRETSRLCRIGGWAAGDLADEGRSTHDGSAVAGAYERIADLQARLDAAHHSVTAPGPRREYEANRETLAAEAGRITGEATSATWHGVADQWTQCERPYRTAYAQWREAEAALAAGDRDTATAAWRSAHLVATQLGATPLLDSLDALGRRARIGPSTERANAGPPRDELERFGLTPREREVLALLADGRTNRQIADHLFISESTAGVHVSNILGKLGAANRVEAAAIAFRLGAGPPASPPDLPS